MIKVCVLGLWHLGTVTSACLANFYQVIGFDKNQSTIASLKSAKSPISEPGIDQLLQKNLERGRLSFTTDIKEALDDAHYIILASDTPLDDQDRVDLTGSYETINKIAEMIKDNVVIIIQSQVPVGTCEDFIRIIKQKRPTLKFGLAYCPENLRLGKAIEVFEKPDRIIIGANDEFTIRKTESFYDFLNCPKIKMDLRSAEMTKHVVNAFLATCISFVNWMGNMCELIHADAKKVSEGLMSEERVGRTLPLRPGLGFSGGTLSRDLRILEKLANDFNVKPNLIETVIEINYQQNILIVKKLRKMFETLDGITIGILGLTYKSGTNTLRRSGPIDVILELLKFNTKVNAHDPSISTIDLIQDKNFRLYDSAYTVAEGSDVLVIFTDWPEFKQLDYKKIYNKMRKAVIFDMRNILDGSMLRDMGFDYRSF
jgi:UDPglucose 6-dehydrogenase